MNLHFFLNNKSNTHQALWVGIGSLSSFSLSIISAAILSRYFDKTEYGTYRQILYVYNSLLVVFTAGLPRVFAFYLPRYDLTQGKDIVWKVSKVLLIFGFIFSIFLFTFSGLIANILKNPELSAGLKYFSPVPMLLLPTLGIEGIFSTYKKTIFIAIYNTSTRLLTLMFIVLPVIIFKGSYLYAVYGWLIVSIITLIIAYYIKGIPFKNISYKKSGLTIKEILRYSLPLTAASMAGIAIKAADQFYISRYFGIEVFAEFANGFVELPLAHMITGATSTVLMPLFSKIVHDKSNIEQLTNIWQSALQKSAIIIYPLVIYFIFYAKEIVTILYSSKYIDSSTYFTIALTINFFNVIVFTPLILALGETRFYARLHLIFAISAWLIGYLVVVIFKSPIAVAIFSTLQTISIVISAMIFSAKRINIKFVKLFPINKLSKIGIHALISVLIVRLAMKYIHIELSNLEIILISFVSFATTLIILSYVFKIDYKQIINPLVNK